MTFACLPTMGGRNSLQITEVRAFSRLIHCGSKSPSWIRSYRFVPWRALRQIAGRPRWKPIPSPKRFRSDIVLAAGSLDRHRGSGIRVSPHLRAARAGPKPFFNLIPDGRRFKIIRTGAPRGPALWAVAKRSCPSRRIWQYEY